MKKLFVCFLFVLLDAYSMSIVVEIPRDMPKRFVDISSEREKGKCRNNMALGLTTRMSSYCSVFHNLHSLT